MRRMVFWAIVIVATATLISFGFAKFSGSSLEVKAYFRDAQGLRAGAPVRMAGVDIGSVKSVRVRPELREKAAEVMLTVRTPYELHVPNDAVVSISQSGVLGPTFADISIVAASGPPLSSGGILQTREAENLSTQQLLEKVGSVLQRKPCEAEAPPVSTKNRSSEKSASPQR